MAVNPILTVYPRAEMSALDFSMLIQHLMPDYYGILTGCSVSGNSDGLTIHITEGWCMVAGRLVHIPEGNINDVPLAASGTQTKYIILTVNLANASSPANIEILDTNPSNGNITPAQFNLDNGTAYLYLGHFTASSTSISSVSGAVKMVRGACVKSGTSEPASSFGKDGDIYIKYS